VTATLAQADTQLTTVDLREQVGAVLDAFLTGQAAVLRGVGHELEPAMNALREALMVGGKRLRPAFCYWGWCGAGGDPREPGIVLAAASLELLHGCALIHDDIMDGSDLRRGLPSVHRRFADLHDAKGWSGPGEAFGTASGILLGDLCLSWCDELFDACGLPAGRVAAAKTLFHQMRTELIAGQYLDIFEQAVGGSSVERARRVIRYKTAKYTVERPLQLGAVLAGADRALLDRYTAFALPLGEAFQLRDDVLGVFGDPARTGKPAGDDLREGKRTVLVALAYRAASSGQRADLERWLGDPALDSAGVERLRAVIVETGALERVERLIARGTRSAMRALLETGLPPGAGRALSLLATAATDRAA
jgi:geranylgeranyl diphosphate synthase type I